VANESVFKYGTAKTLANANGAAITNNQLSAAAGTLYSQTDTLDYPDAVFVWAGATGSSFGGTPTAGSTLDLFIRPLDINGTTDQPAPETGSLTDAYKGQYIGSFVLKASSAAGNTYRCVGYDIPRAGEAYVFNNATGQSVTANWTLIMTPRTVGPA
jgi:hypothetical protein